MTIPQKQGFGIPGCLLMQANKHFNMRDQTGTAILTKQGIGIKWLDPETRVEYELPQYQAAKAARQNQTLAEEMRLLYVALTRAQQRLYVVGATMSGNQLTSADKTVEKWAAAAEGEARVLAPQVLQWGNELSRLDRTGLDQTSTGPWVSRNNYQTCARR